MCIAWYIGSREKTYPVAATVAYVMLGAAFRINAFLGRCFSESEWKRFIHSGEGFTHMACLIDY